MTNPLIAKYEEIYGKKEEPKKVEPPEFWKESPFAYDPTTSVTTLKNINPNSVSTITAVNPSRAFMSYEPTEDAFLDVAGKVQRGDAKVVSMHMNMEHFRKSYTFEVQVYT